MGAESGRLWVLCEGLFNPDAGGSGGGGSEHPNSWDDGVECWAVIHKEHPHVALQT